MPAFAYSGSPQCDADGSLYFHSANEPITDVAIFKLAQPDENGSRMFRLPKDLYEANSFLAFAVSSSGALHILTQESENVFHVFTLNSDGDVKGDAKLDIPDHLFLINLAVFGNETFVVVGYYLQDAPEKLKGKGYVAVFDSSGKLLRDLTNTSSLEKADPDPSAAYKGIAMRSAPDGNIYLLKNRAVLVISPTGEIIRRLKLTAPDPKDTALELLVSEGLVAIGLGDSPAPGRQPPSKYLVLDATTGREFGYFARPEEHNVLLACFTRENGFSFLSYEKNHFRISTSALQ